MASLNDVLIRQYVEDIILACPDYKFTDGEFAEDKPIRGYFDSKHPRKPQTLRIELPIIITAAVRFRVINNRTGRIVSSSVFEDAPASMVAAFANSARLS